MDILTLAIAQAIAEAAGGGAPSGVIEELQAALEQVSQDVDSLETDASTIDQDGDLATKLLTNALRQHIWQSKDNAPVCESGTVTLTNGRKFPFNNSQVTVSLVNRQPNTDYAVVAAATTIAGNIGEITISDKQVNGFKIAFTGGAASAAVKYIVIGGIIK